jgi:segregation and condensation protein B
VAEAAEAAEADEVPTPAGDEADAPVEAAPTTLTESDPEAPSPDEVDPHAVPPEKPHEPI